MCSVCVCMLPLRHIVIQAYWLYFVLWENCWKFPPNTKFPENLQPYLSLQCFYAVGWWHLRYLAIKQIIRKVLIWEPCQTCSDSECLGQLNKCDVCCGPICKSSQKIRALVSSFGHKCLSLLGLNYDWRDWFFIRIVHVLLLAYEANKDR